MFLLCLKKRHYNVPDPSEVKFFKCKLSLKVKGFYFFKKTKSTNNKKTNTLFKVTHPKFSSDIEKHLKDGIY